VRRDGPKVPPFRCVWSWLRRRSTWRSAQTNAEKERMPTSLLAFSSPVWHDERQSGSASPSLAALRPDPWNISAVQSRWPGRRRAFEGGGASYACLPIEHRKAEGEKVAAAWHVIIQLRSKAGQLTPSSLQKRRLPKMCCRRVRILLLIQRDCFVPRLHKWLWCHCQSGFVSPTL